MSLNEIQLLILLEQQQNQDLQHIVNHLIDEHLKQVKNKIFELQNFPVASLLRQSCITQTTIKIIVRFLKSLEC